MYENKKGKGNDNDNEKGENNDERKGQEAEGQEVEELGRHPREEEHQQEVEMLEMKTNTQKYYDNEKEIG